MEDDETRHPSIARRPALSEHATAFGVRTPAAAAHCQFTGARLCCWSQGTTVALTETELQEVVAHVKSMLPSMMTEVVPGFAESRMFADRVITRIEENLGRVESHLARSEERWEQEFKAQRDLMHAGFAAMDKRFEDVDKRFEDVNRRFDDVNKRFEDVNRRFEDVDKRFEDVNRRFEDVNQRFEDMNKRFSSLQWMGTVAFVVLGIVVTVVGLA